MQTFTTWAFKESAGLVSDLNLILGNIIDDKKTVRDQEALKVLTNVQAALIAARTRAGDMRGKFETADRLGEHRDLLAPEIDHKRAAGADYDEPEPVLP